MSLQLYFFFFNDTATTEIYTLSLHDALPICLHRTGTYPENRRLWRDVLHAHRVSWFPRDHGHDHADRHPRPLDRGPFPSRPPLRLRGRGLVLALRGRGVARPVHLRVLALIRE